MEEVTKKGVVKEMELVEKRLTMGNITDLIQLRK